MGSNDARQGPSRGGEGRILGYIRVSDPKQADSGLGIDAQRRAIVEAFGEPAAWFEDLSEHGDRADRPGLVALLDAVDRGDTVAVAKRDRLARETVLNGWICHELRRKGAVVRSAEGNGHEETALSRLLEQVLAAFAEFEVQRIRERTRQALAEKRARHEKCGGRPPFGYRIGGYVERGGGKRVPTLEPDPEQQAAIARALEMRAAGMTLRHIADTLGLGHPQAVKRIVDRASQAGHTEGVER